MPLDPEKIKQLQAIKNKPRSRAGGGPGRGRKRKGPDLTTIESRTYETWFDSSTVRIQFQYEDDDGNVQMRRCTNPNCLDPRTPDKGGIMVVEINGEYCCRYCFIDGWLVVDPEQQTIEAA